MSTIANDFIDFSYCGHTLSEYDGIIGDINGGDGVSPIDIGNVLNMLLVESLYSSLLSAVITSAQSYPGMVL